jgi:hypothetical protein
MWCTLTVPFSDPSWKLPQVTYTTVKTAHFHPATCNLAHLLTRHGSPTIYQHFAIPQLLYRLRHQSGIFWIPPRTSVTNYNSIATITSESFELVYFFLWLKAPVESGFLVMKASRSNTYTQSIGLLRTSDPPDVEICNWQHKTLSRNRHQCPRRDSNPRFQQASCRRLTH